jgi:hypothetical protein
MRGAGTWLADRADMEDAKLDKLSDTELLAQAHRVYRRSRACNAELVRVLIAVHKRRLHLKKSHPSLFEFCVKRLGMSNASAHRFSVAARLATQFPELVTRIERGEIHLSTLVQMRHHVTAENVNELLELAQGRTRYQVEELLASVAPRPDAPSRMRKLPTPRVGPSVAPVERALEPLAPERYRVQFTADRATHDDILQARDLMRHSNPNGDLEPVLKYCARAGVEKLEARQRGLIRQRGARTQDRPPAPSSRHVPRAIRRAVYERDGAQCTFHDDGGHRCSAKTLLELDHIDPYALGGLHTVENLRVRCRPHNGYYAEKIFGKSFIEKCIRARKHESAPHTSIMNGAGGQPKTPKAKLTPKGLKKTKEPRIRETRGSSNGAGSFAER